ncbi:carboxypeptidase regulatory-like domain-containing protein [Taibaiella koreensis]|uniref:carboxypeptidase regulatory-like domain-containing protein n=1 Tax=Taibaiella koreensis TaxID=1268548 RepID=UPI000E59A9F8|nr:carboxypeptidase regulatory-like domain-containing protein [Taibaiella koreensis]
MRARILLKIGIGLLLLCAVDTQAQCLGKIVSLQLPEQQLSTALDALGRSCGCHFAFETGVLPDKMVSLRYRDKTVQAILDDLLDQAYTYSEEQGYIVLKPSPRVIVSGRIKDAADGTPLAAVTVKGPVEMVVSDERGRYRISLPATGSDHRISFSKVGYTTQQIPAGGQSAMPDIAMVQEVIYLPEVAIEDDPAGRGRQGALRHMTDLNTSGVKMGGLLHINTGEVQPLQLSLVLNYAARSYRGIQFTTIHNEVKDTLKGLQFAGVINKTEGHMMGGQVGCFNYARINRGLQVGVINIADSTTGWSLGLLNVVKGSNGYRRFSFYSNNINNANIALKTGNANLYNIWMLGYNISGNNLLITVGLGLGHDFILSRRLRLATQVSYHLVDGGVGFENRLAQLKLLPEWRLSRYFSISAGPVLNWYKNRYGPSQEGFKNLLNLPYLHPGDHQNATRTWPGWELGLTFDPRYRYDNPRSRYRAGWTLAFGGGVGLSALMGFQNSSYRLLVRAEKYLFDDIAFTLSSGYVWVDGYPMKIVPLTAGLKVFQERLLYVAVEAGGAFLSGGQIIEQKRMVVNLAPSIGINLGDKLDFSMRCDFFGVQEIHLGACLAYGISWSHKPATTPAR